jgi:hypothetical protein
MSDYIPDSDADFSAWLEGFLSYAEITKIKFCRPTPAHNKSLDASGGSVFRNLIRPAMLD